MKTIKAIFSGVGVIIFMSVYSFNAAAGDGISTGDTYDDELWGHKKIKISDAWDNGKGEGITVALIDTGIDYNHQDLCNSTECNIKKVNSGYGVNFLVEESSSERNEVMDKHGHGTHIAGIITAIENDKGVVGVAPKAKILALKAVADDGTADIADIAEAINYAANPDKGNADVIICSFGSVSTPGDDTLKEAVEYAHGKGVPIIIPAGDDDEDSGYSTLAQYPETIVVSASTKKDRKYSSSNWGTRIVVAAPGEKILSTMTSNSDKNYKSDKEEDGYGYTYLSGTHQASAYAAGVAACMLSKKDSLKPEQIRWVLRTSAADANSDVLSGWDLYFGDGRINADEALKMVKNNNYPNKDSRSTITSPTFKETLENGENKIKAKAHGTAYILEYAKASFSVKDNSLEDGETSGSYSFTEIARSEDDLDADGTKVATWDTSDIIKDGNYILRLYVNDDNGCTLTDNLRVVINNDHFGISSPEEGNILSAKKSVKIKGNANGTDFSSYELSYSTDKNTWTSMTTSTAAVSNDGTLAAWDASALDLSEVKKYYLRLTATYGSSTYTDDVKIYLDPNLNSNWPQEEEIYAANDINEERDFAITLEDMDQDGKTDIITATTEKNDGDIVPKISVYGGTGTKAYSKSFTDLAGSVVLAPVSIGDIQDGDDKKDEIALTINQKNSDGSEVGYVRVFDYSAKTSVDFKVEDVEFKNPAVIADLENDGKPELIVTSDKYLHIGQIDSSDSTKYYNYRYEIGSHSYDDYYRMPIAGNFDSDEDLEIVAWGIKDGKDTLYLLDYDSSASSPITKTLEWNVADENIAITSIAGADIDNDDSLDIIVAGEKDDTSENSYKGWICAYKNDGSALSGWPRENEHSFGHYPAIFDKNQDGKMEIAMLDIEGNLRILNSSGSITNYQPTGESDTAFTGLSPTIGNLDSDSDTEDIISSINHYFYANEEGNDEIIKGRVNNLAPLVTFADVDGDGKTEIVASLISGVAYNEVNEIYKTKGYIYVWDLKNTYNADYSHWPTFQGNNQRTGVYSNPDKTAPEISLTLYTSTKGSDDKTKYTSSNSQLTLDVTVGKEDSSGIKQYAYKVQYKNSDGTYTDVDGASGTFGDFDEIANNMNIFVTLADSTTYRIALKATDNAGNESEYVYSDDITTDITSPTAPSDLKVNSSTSDVSVKSDFSVSWTASTDSTSGIKNYPYEVKDSSGNVKKSGTAASASVTISIGSGDSKLSDGDYYVYVKAQDYAGNKSTVVQSSKITISTTTPNKPSSITVKHSDGTTANTYNNKYYYINSKSFTVTWTGSSSKYEYQIITKKSSGKTKDTLVSSTETTSTTASISISGSVSDGTDLYFQVRAKDSAGNTSEYAEQKIKYDSTKISTSDITLTVPSKISSTSQIDVTFQAKDSVSGVWYYAYIISTSSSDPSSSEWDTAYASTSGASGSKSKVDAGNKAPNTTDKTKKTISGLSLTNGSTYYLHCRAKNGAGLWSSTKKSSSIKVSLGTTKAKK